MSSEGETRQPPEARPRPSWAGRLVLAVVFVVLCAAGYGIVQALQSEVKSDSGPRSMSPDEFVARFAQLSDSTPVIGVEAGGRYRAYVLRSFMRPDAHVYNDLLGKVPITVTYCDLSRCVRVFTAPGRERPLDVAGGGPEPHHARKMLLQVGDKHYCQDTGLPPEGEGTTPFPYADAPFVRTTWGEWRAAHPDTDVYVGKLPSKFKNSHLKLKLAFPPEPAD